MGHNVNQPEHIDAALAHFDRVARSDAFKAPEQLIRADIDMIAWATTRPNVPAEKPFYNGITAYENGYAKGLEKGQGSADEEYNSGWNQGHKTGYTVGEGERVALSVANGELRSLNSEMRTIIRQVRALVANNEPYGTILRYLSEAAGTA